MKIDTTNDKKTKRASFYIVSGVMGIFLLILLGWWMLDIYAPRPLNDKLEYVGKSSYGCYLMCDSAPTSVYYYATDMSVQELIAHFESATIDQAPRTLNGITDFSLKAKGGETIYIYYYENKADVAKHHLRPSNKKYVIDIPSFKYQLVKETLDDQE